MTVAVNPISSAPPAAAIKPRNALPPRPPDDDDDAEVESTRASMRNVAMPIHAVCPEDRQPGLALGSGQNGHRKKADPNFC